MSVLQARLGTHRQLLRATHTAAGVTLVRGRGESIDRIRDRSRPP